MTWLFRALFIYFLSSANIKSLSENCKINKVVRNLKFSPQSSLNISLIWNLQLPSNKTVSEIWWRILEMAGFQAEQPFLVWIIRCHSCITFCVRLAEVLPCSRSITCTLSAFSQSQVSMQISSSFQPIRIEFAIIHDFIMTTILSAFPEVSFEAWDLSRDFENSRRWP